MEYLNEATTGGNAPYFFYTLLLLAVFSGLNTYLRYKHPTATETALNSSILPNIDKYVITVIVFVIFWGFGSGLFKLILCTFFAFGLYSEVIKPLEGLIYKYARKGWSWIAQKLKNITTLYNK